MIESVIFDRETELTYQVFVKIYIILLYIGVGVYLRDTKGIICRWVAVYLGAPQIVWAHDVCLVFSAGGLQLSIGNNECMCVAKLGTCFGHC